MCVCVVYVNSKEKCVLRESGRERERVYILCEEARGDIRIPIVCWKQMEPPSLYVVRIAATPPDILFFELFTFLLLY